MAPSKGRKRQRMWAVFGPPWLALLCFGGTPLLAWLCLTYLLFWLADILRAPFFAGAAAAAMHASAVLVLWRRCYTMYRAGATLHSGRSAAHATTTWTNTLTSTVLLPTTIFLFAACSMAWTLLQFPDFRGALDAGTAVRVRRGIVAVLGPVATALAAWMAAATLSHAWAPWLCLAIALLNHRLLGFSSELSSSLSADASATTPGTTAVHTANMRYAAGAWLLIPAGFYFSLHHKSLGNDTKILWDGAALVFIPLADVALRSASNTSSTRQRVSTAVFLIASAVCLFADYAIGLSSSMVSSWDAVTFASAGMSAVILSIATVVRVRLPSALEFALFMAAAFGAMACMHTPTVVATVLAPLLAWSTIKLRSCISSSFTTTTSVLSMLGGRASEDSYVLTATGAEYMVLLVVLMALAASSAAFSMFWGAGDGHGSVAHAYRVDVPLLPSFKQISLFGLSQLAVWASAALMLVPPLLHRGRIAGRLCGCRDGSQGASLRSPSSSSASSSSSPRDRHAWRLTSLAGKALVFHAAAMALVEVIVLSQILSTRLRSTKMLFSAATSAIGSWASYVVANPFEGKKQTRSTVARRWRMKAPVQDAWMATCIHVAKLGVHVPDYEVQAIPGAGTPTESRVGVVMGTFIIVSVLSAPFVWYERGTASAGSGDSAGAHIAASRLNAHEPRKRSVRITPPLAMAHIVAAVIACSIYRAVLLDSVLPFLHGLLPDTVSAIVSGAVAVPLEQRRPLTFGAEMSVLGAWLFMLLSWHFPREVPMRRVAAALVAFGACFVVFRPTLDMRSGVASLLSDSGLLVTVQSWENPVTHAPFFYDYLGHRKPVPLLWRPWALIVAGLMVVMATMQIIAFVMPRKQYRESAKGTEGLLALRTIRNCAQASVFGVVMGAWLITSRGVSAGRMRGHQFGDYSVAYTFAFTAVTLAAAFFLIKHIFLMFPWVESTAQHPRMVLHAYALLVALLLVRVVFQEIAIAATTTDAMMHSEDVSDHLSDSLLGGIFTGRRGGLLKSVSWALSLHGCLNVGIAMASRFVLHKMMVAAGGKAARPLGGVGRSNARGGGGLRSISSRWQIKKRTLGATGGRVVSDNGQVSSVHTRSNGGKASAVAKRSLMGVTLTSLGRSASIVASGCVLALGLLWHTPEGWLLGRELAVFVSAALLFLAPPLYHKRSESGEMNGTDLRRESCVDKRTSSVASTAEIWRLHSDRAVLVFTYVCVTLDMMAVVFDIVFPWLFLQHVGWSSVRNLVTFCGVVPLQTTCRNAMCGYPGCNLFSYLIFPIPMTLVALLFNQSRNEIIVTCLSLSVWAGIAAKRWRWSWWDL